MAAIHYVSCKKNIFPHEHSLILTTNCCPEGGRVTVNIYEIDGLNEEEAKEAFKACSHKLPIKTKLVSRREL